MVDFCSIKIFKKLPIFYYDSELNAGDELNKYLLESLSGRKVYRVKTNFFRHILTIGSILSYSNKKSVIYGSGFIDIPSRGSFECCEIAALRGKLTQAVLERSGIYFEGPLGDPALLTPDFLSIDIYKKYKLDWFFIINIKAQHL